MKYIKPILILGKACYKMQTRSKKVFLFTFITPIAYTVIFIAQIGINYSVVKNPFIDLTIGQYLMVFFALQAIVFLSFDQSQRFVAKEILSGGFDYLLLRPISLGYFKYFRVQSILAIILVNLYLLASIVTGILYNISPAIILMLVVFVFSAGIIIINIRSGMRGLVFFFRDALNTSRVEESLNIFVINKPPEIFPGTVQTILTILLPFFVVHNNAFNIIREINVVNMWILILCWIIIAVMFNKLIWQLGIRRYESG